jgi:transcriptional regulator with XRE-family HTH domain
MLTLGMKTLGDQIRMLRDQHDLSLREFARKLGDVTAAHISDIENGRRNPSTELLEKIARVLAVPIEELEKLGSGLPIDELRDAVRKEPALGFALRKVAEQGISAEELLAFTRKRQEGLDKK